MSVIVELEPVVEDLVQRLEEMSSTLTISGYFLKDSKTGTSYWIGGSTSSYPITEIWEKNNEHEVFSREQGQRIRKALKVFVDKTGNPYQQKLLERFSKTEKPSKEKEEVGEVSSSFWKKLFRRK